MTVFDRDGEHTVNVHIRPKKGAQFGVLRGALRRAKNDAERIKIQSMIDALTARRIVETSGHYAVINKP